MHIKKLYINSFDTLTKAANQRVIREMYMNDQWILLQVFNGFVSSLPSDFSMKYFSPNKIKIVTVELNGVYTGERLAY